MKIQGISIFGLGYVGCVGMGCLAKQKYKVIGIDVNTHKIDQINLGKPTIIEKDIDKLISEGHRDGFISATTDSSFGIKKTSISFICVGTPNGPYGHLNLNGVFTVAEQIGISLKSKDDFHVVVIRSTVLPGTNEKVKTIIEKASGKKAGQDFSVVSNPEFLREGTAVEDYFNPEITVIGTDSEKAKDMLSLLYSNINSEIIFTSIKSAELIKYINNSYHALKITFANEIGNICKKIGVDSHEVMEIFCQDTKLNISSRYFKPGHAYGGSCLPKDLKGLNSLSHDLYLESPVLESIERSNAVHKEIILNAIIETGKKKIGFLGLSFKKGTDDLRNSPTVEIVERLSGKGFWINIYDENVHLSNLTGTNKEEIEKRIPKIKDYISGDLSEVIKSSDVIVISYKDKDFIDRLKEKKGKVVIDLARIDSELGLKENYHGIAW